MCCLSVALLGHPVCGIAGPSGLWHCRAIRFVALQGHPVSSFRKLVFRLFFDVLLTVHLSIILVINQLNEQYLVLQ